MGTTAVIDDSISGLFLLRCSFRPSPEQNSYDVPRSSTIKNISMCEIEMIGSSPLQRHTSQLGTHHYNGIRRLGAHHYKGIRRLGAHQHHYNSIGSSPLHCFFSDVRLYCSAEDHSLVAAPLNNGRAEVVPPHYIRPTRPSVSPRGRPQAARSENLTSAPLGPTSVPAADPKPPDHRT